MWPHPLFNLTCLLTLIGLCVNSCIKIRSIDEPTSLRDERLLLTGNNSKSWVLTEVTNQNFLPVFPLKECESDDSYTFRTVDSAFSYNGADLRCGDKDTNYLLNWQLIPRIDTGSIAQRRQSILIYTHPATQKKDYYWIRELTVERMTLMDTTDKDQWRYNFRFKR
jgi:hypothetical protein